VDERRVGAPERELAMGALDEHRRAERLDADEYRRRSAAAARARVRGDLDGLFADLPRPHPVYPGYEPDAGREIGHDAPAPAPVADDRAIDLPELVTPVAATVARHAGLLSLLAPVIAFGLFAATGFRFPFVFLLVPVAIGVLTWLGHRHGG
jgi:hypothetical protein